MKENAIQKSKPMFKLQGSTPFHFFLFSRLRLELEFWLHVYFDWSAVSSAEFKKSCNIYYAWQKIVTTAKSLALLKINDM